MSDTLIDINGLPKQLSILLGTLISQNTINNWCIYQNRNKSTCITIRFTDSGVLDTIQPVKYRKVSDNQAARSKQRARQYQNNNTVNNTNIHTHGTPLFNPSTSKEMVTSNVQSPPHMSLPILSPILESDCNRQKVDDISPETIRKADISCDTLNDIDTPTSVVEYEPYNNNTPNKFQKSFLDTVDNISLF